MNATVLEARDKEERQRMARFTHPSGLQAPEPHVEKDAEQRRREPPAKTCADGASTPVCNLWVEVRVALTNHSRGLL